MAGAETTHGFHDTGLALRSPGKKGKPGRVNEPKCPEWQSTLLVRGRILLTGLVHSSRKPKRATAPKVSSRRLDFSFGRCLVDVRKPNVKAGGTGPVIPRSAISPRIPRERRSRPLHGNPSRWKPPATPLRLHRGTLAARDTGQRPPRSVMTTSWPPPLEERRRWRPGVSCSRACKFVAIGRL